MQFSTYSMIPIIKDLTNWIFLCSFGSEKLFIFLKCSLGFIVPILQVRMCLREVRSSAWSHTATKWWHCSQMLQPSEIRLGVSTKCILKAVACVFFFFFFYSGPLWECESIGLSPSKGKYFLDFGWVVGLAEAPLSTPSLPFILWALQTVLWSLVII